MEFRKWMVVDYVLVFVRFFYYGVGILYFINNPDEIGMSSSFFYLWFALCIFVPHLFWRPGYINDVLFAITEFLLVGSFHLYFIFYLHTPLGMSLLLMPSLIIGFIAKKHTLIFSPFILFLLVFSLYYVEQDVMGLLNYILIVSALFIFGYLFNYLLRTQIKMKSLLDENEKQTALIQSQNKALEQYTKKVEEFTLSNERNRIAGELHDTIGHTFTSVIIGMDAVMYLMETAPVKAKEKLAVLRDVTKNGLQQLREHIHDMATEDDDTSLTSKLEKLAKEFSEYTQTTVVIEQSGEEYRLTKAISGILLRCLQEALTNAKRHGDASDVKVTLHFRPDGIQLVISDNGNGTGEIQFGFGLQTMKERLSTIQGDLSIQTKTAGGTTVTCFIPMKGVPNEQYKTIASR